MRITIALAVAGLLAAACDQSGPTAGGSGGSAGNAVAGQGGVATQPRPTLLSPNHYQVAVPGSLGMGGTPAGGTSGGSGGADGNAGGASGNAGSGPSALACVFTGPTGTSQNRCGDGFLDGTEQCDDGNTANGDACSSTCGVTPTLIAPHAGSSGALPFPGRELGTSGHSAAVGCNTVGVAFLDRAPTPAALELALFSSVGHAQGVVDLGGASVDSPNPSLAGLPDDSFVAAWTAFDSDELGIRLRKVAGGAAMPAPGTSASAAPAEFANVEQAFSQRAPDVVFDGSQLIVAWVDDSDPVTSPDLRFRTFAPDLSPTSDDQTLTATGAIEDHVTLAASGGQWAAAWRAGSGGMETIEVQSGAVHWSVGPFLPGASDDRPALAFVDATHLALAFTEGTDPLASGVANVPRLHAAVLDRAYPGHTESFRVEPTVAPYSTLLELGQTQPAVVSFADRLVIGWRSGSIVGDPVGDELWSRELKWSPGAANTLVVDTSAVEQPLLPSGALRAGDQAKLTLLNSSSWPNHRLLSVWEEDSHRVLANSSGLPDVLLQFSEVPGELAPPPPGPCTGATLTASPAGPAVDFTSVTLSAAATCGAGGEAEYEFGYQAPGTTALTYIRGWGPATVNWSTAGLPSGAYVLYGYARRKGTNVGFDSAAGLGYLVGKVCNANPSFGIAPTGVQPVGTVLSLSAGATCTLGGTPEYHFFYQLPGSSSWVNIGNWSTTPVNWDTAGLPSGNYTLLAYVRAAGNASNVESSAYGGALIGNVCYATNSVSGSPASPQGIGATIALSATATCVGSATPEFLYYYYSPSGGAPVQVGTWSAAPVSWNTAGLPAGNFGLLALARAVGNNSGGGESKAYGGFQLGALCPSVTMSASPVGTQPIGTSVTVTSSAGCNPAEYQSWYRLWGNSLWIKYRDWLTSPTSTWDTTGLASGLYELRTDVRFAGHTGSEANTQISYLIGNVCTDAALSASPTSPQVIGTSVALTGSANCTGGATPEYQFYYRAPASTATIPIRDWGPATFSWSTASLAPGAYNVLVYARAVGNTDNYESAGVRSFTLQTPP